MRKKISITVLFSIFLICRILGNPQEENSVIVTKPNKGRTGDQLITFIHALNFSLRYQYPLYYHPFKDSYKFMFSLMYGSTKELTRTFDHHVVVQSFFDFPCDLEGDNRYIVPFYVDGCLKHDANHPGTSPSYDDPEFIERVRICLQPTIPLNIITPPKGRISVALHLRTGGSYDSEMELKRIPLKFNSEESCLEMVHWLSAHLNHPKIYVHVFTDSETPETVLKWFRKKGRRNIKWGISMNEEDPDPVLSDFFSMMNFNYLIRPRSNFSFLAQMLGNYRLVLVSENAHYDQESKKVIVDEFRCYHPEEFISLYYSEGCKTGGTPLQWNTP